MFRLEHGIAVVMERPVFRVPSSQGEGTGSCCSRKWWGGGGRGGGFSLYGALVQESKLYRVDLASPLHPRWPGEEAVFEKLPNTQLVSPALTRPHPSILVLVGLEGKVMLQNLPSVAAAAALAPAPGSRVLDMCAAPGGKTTMLAQLMGDRGEVVALDRSHAKVDEARGAREHDTGGGEERTGHRVSPGITS